MRVPRLWTETIETHRREVRDAIVETAGRLAISHGLLSVTMSQIAEETGSAEPRSTSTFPMSRRYWPSGMSVMSQVTFRSWPRSPKALKAPTCGCGRCW